jgi:hypothetical protein
MAQRSLAESQEHANLIRMMANYFQNQGCTDIRADLPAWSQPIVIAGTMQNHQPDLTCRRNDARQTFIILEAETASTISDQHTASQWVLFADAARQWGGEFHVIVPKFVHGRSGHDAARQRARQLGITLHQTWVPS